MFKITHSLVLSLLVVGALGQTRDNAKKINPNECGRRFTPARRARQIVGGSISDGQDWRWQVFIYKSVYTLVSAYLDWILSLIASN